MLPIGANPSKNTIIILALNRKLGFSKMLRNLDHINQSAARVPIKYQLKHNVLILKQTISMKVISMKVIYLFNIYLYLITSISQTEELGRANW